MGDKEIEPEPGAPADLLGEMRVLRRRARAARRGTFPFVIIAAGLWALAWAERSPALAGIAAAYTGTALLASLYDIENLLFRLGWNPAPGQEDLASLPNVLLPALVLLAAGAGAFAVQRRRRTAT
jgi:hypothetical protein